MLSRVVSNQSSVNEDQSSGGGSSCALRWLSLGVLSSVKNFCWLKRISAEVGCRSMMQCLNGNSMVCDT